MHIIEYVKMHMHNHTMKQMMDTYIYDYLCDAILFFFSFFSF